MSEVLWKRSGPITADVSAVFETRGHQNLWFGYNLISGAFGNTLLVRGIDPFDNRIPLGGGPGGPRTAPEYFVGQPNAGPVTDLVEVYLPFSGGDNAVVEMWVIGTD